LVLLAIAVIGIFNAQLNLAHDTLFVTRITICVDCSNMIESSNSFSISIFHLFTNSFQLISNQSKFNSSKFFFSVANGLFSIGLFSGSSTLTTSHVVSLTSHDKTTSHVATQ
jgi:hypothetical protein